MVLDIVSLLMGYLAGFATLAIPLSIWVYKINRKHSKLIKQAKQDAEQEKRKIEEMSERMRKVQTITKMQNDLIAQTQAPSASASHSKYKNDLVRQVKDLEEEKVCILESIVADGHDPVIVVADPATGEQIEKRLSDFLSMHRKNDTTDTETTRPNAPAGANVKRKGKFFVVEGGEEGFEKDDGDSGDNGPTYH